jgi:hypothetical protein
MLRLNLVRIALMLAFGALKSSQPALGVNDALFGSPLFKC